MNHSAHVIFASDDHGVPALTVALYSLLSTHDYDAHALRVTLLNGSGDFSSASRAQLNHVAARFPQAHVEIRTVDAIMEPHRNILAHHSNWPIVAWARCFITQLFPDENTPIVYLDIDTLVTHDLSELYDLNFEKPDGSVDMLAAVYEDRRTPDRTDPPWGNGVMPSAATDYFNSGVLVLNARAFHEEHAIDTLLAWYDKWRARAVCPDQDALNAVFWNRTRALHPRYNHCDGWLERQRHESTAAPHWRGNAPREILEAILDPYILHFWGSHKPWRWNHRPEGARYAAALRACELLHGDLPGTTRLRRLISGAFHIYHAMLRRHVAQRLARLKMEK